jgi:HD-like signal output (HDOD) protein
MEPTMRDRIHELARGVNDLPTLPAIYQQVEAVTSNPDASCEQVARVVGMDPVCASRLLRVVNSARYAPAERVTTITRAVSILGQRAVREIVLVTSVMTLLPHQAGRRRLAESFWRHAIAVGSAARVLSAATGGRPGEEFLFAGLVHDIGRLFWLHFFPNDLEAAVATAESSGRTLLEVELEQTGTTHARLGKILARHWRLPEAYVEAIAYHHDPSATAVNTGLCQAIQAGDAIAHALELGGPSLARVPRVPAQTWRALRVEADAFPDLLEDVQAEFGRNLELFPFGGGESTPDTRRKDKRSEPVTA